MNDPLERPDGPEALAAQVRSVLDAVHRDEWALVLTATLRVAGSLDLAEECTQEAFLLGLQTWPRDGIPRNPGAWLTTAAKRRALDAHRRDQTLRRKLPLLLVDEETEVDAGADFDDQHDSVIGDDRLRLIFTCCHPALAREAQVALTLRLVCGMSTSDIARAFLVSEPTMAARVTRAKKKISAARIPYRIPGPSELPDRLDAALTVLHLLFTTGHTAPTGDELDKPELAERAIALGRLLVRLMPDEGEAQGLLALMLVTHARRASRTSASGQLVLLEDQDRTLWDRAAIAEGHQCVIAALRRGGRPGRFVLQAAIASLHADAPSYADTDWTQIVSLYDLLLMAWPSPVVEMNRAVAVAMASGPSAGLSALSAIDQAPLAGYHYLPAVRADLLRRLGRTREAAESYRAALELCDNAPERAFLAARLADLPDV